MPRLNPLTDQKRIQRILEIIRLLTGPHASLTIEELADEFKVDIRSIQRDLAMLEEAGFKLSDLPRKERKKVLRFEPDAPLSVPFGFTRDELLSLYLTREIYAILKGTPFQKAADSAIQRIEPYIRDQDLDKLRAAVRVIPGPVRNYRDHAETIQALWTAIVDRKAIRMAYDSVSSRKYDRYEVHPYVLVFHNNALYLIAWSEKHQAIRTFAVERISYPEPLPKGFDQPEDLDSLLGLDRHFGIYSGVARDVKIKVFSDHRKRLKAKILHPSQKLTFQKDGSMVVTIRVAGMEDLFQWLLSQGAAVELQEPEDWVKEFKKRIEAISAVYAG